MAAVMATAWCQLDAENAFDLRPALGVRVRNLGPPPKTWSRQAATAPCSHPARATRR